MKPKFPNFHLNEINEGVGVAFLQKKDIPHVHIYVHVRIDCFLVGGGGYFTLKTPLSTAHPRPPQLRPNAGPTPRHADKYRAIRHFPTLSTAPY